MAENIDSPLGKTSSDLASDQDSQVTFRDESAETAENASLLESSKDGVMTKGGIEGEKTAIKENGLQDTAVTDESKEEIKVNEEISVTQTVHDGDYNTEGVERSETDEKNSVSKHFPEDQKQSVSRSSSQDESPCSSSAAEEGNVDLKSSMTKVGHEKDSGISEIGMDLLDEKNANEESCSASSTEGVDSTEAKVLEISKIGLDLHDEKRTNEEESGTVSPIVKVKSPEEGDLDVADRKLALCSEEEVTGIHRVERKAGTGCSSFGDADVQKDSLEYDKEGKQALHLSFKTPVMGDDIEKCVGIGDSPVSAQKMQSHRNMQVDEPEFKNQDKEVSHLSTEKPATSDNIETSVGIGDIPVSENDMQFDSYVQIDESEFKNQHKECSLSSKEKPLTSDKIEKCVGIDDTPPSEKDTQNDKDMQIDEAEYEKRDKQASLINTEKPVIKDIEKYVGKDGILASENDTQIDKDMQIDEPKFRTQDRKTSLSSKDKPVTIDNIEKSVGIPRAKSSEETPHLCNGDVLSGDEPMEDLQSESLLKAEIECSSGKNAAQNLANNVEQDLSQAKQESEGEAGKNDFSTSEKSDKLIDKHEEVRNCGIETHVENVIDNALIVENEHETSLMEGGKILSEEEQCELRVENKSGALDLECISNEKVLSEEALDKSNVTTLAVTSENKSNEKTIADVTLSQEVQDKSNVIALSEKEKDKSNVTDLSDALWDKPNEKALSEEVQDRSNDATLSETESYKTLSSLLQADSNSNVKTLLNTPHGESNQANVRGEKSTDSAIGVEKATVIHVLTSDEEEEGEQLTPTISSSNDSQDLVECSIHFSDVQCNIRKQLDSEPSTQLPKARNYSCTIAAQADTYKCYGDGTFCVECGRVFSLQSYFSDHISSHYVGVLSALGQCALCGLIFTNSFARTQHLVSAQKRMETAMRVIKWDGLVAKRKSTTSNPKSKWVVIESEPEDNDSNSDTEKHITSPVADTEQTSKASPLRSSENQRGIELPDGTKRKRKAPEKFVVDSSPSFKRRKSLHRKNSRSNSNASEFDPEVEAYLSGLMREGLTVDPAALGLKPNSAAAKVPSSFKKSIVQGFHNSNNTVSVDQNGGISISLGKKGNFGSPPPQLKNRRVISTVHCPNTVVLNSNNSNMEKPIRFNENLGLVQGKTQGGIPTISTFQKNGSRLAVSLLPASLSTAAKLAPHGLSTPAPVQSNTDHKNNAFSNLPPQPKKHQSQYYVKTTLASSPHVQDSRIYRLCCKRISRKDSQGCKRVRNVCVRLRKLIIPILGTSQWPVWSLKSASPQTQISLNSPGQTKTSNILQSHRQNPVEPDRSPSFPHRDEQLKRNLPGMDPRTLRKAVPVVKLNKIPVNSSTDVNNRTSVPASKKFSPTVPLLAQFQNAGDFHRSKEQSRHAVEEMLQSLAIPSIARNPTNLTNQQNQQSIVCSVKNGSVVEIRNNISGFLSQRERLSNEAITQSDRSGYIFRRLENSPKISNSSDDVIVIDDDEEIEEIGPEKQQKSPHPSTPKLPFSRQHSKVEVRERPEKRQKSPHPSTPKPPLSAQHSKVLKSFAEVRESPEKRQKSADPSMPKSPLRLQHSKVLKSFVEVREIAPSESSKIVDISSNSKLNLSDKSKEQQPVKCGERRVSEEAHSVSEETDSIKPLSEEEQEEEDLCGWEVCVAESSEDSGEEEDDKDTDNLSSDTPKIQSEFPVSTATGKKDSKSEGNCDTMGTSVFYEEKKGIKSHATENTISVATNENDSRTESSCDATRSDDITAEEKNKKKLDRTKTATCESTDIDHLQRKKLPISLCGSNSTNKLDCAKIPTAEPTERDQGQSNKLPVRHSEVTKTPPRLHSGSESTEICRSLSQTEVVSIPPHLENSSNIQDIFSEIEKTCREMQENSENNPRIEDS